jgi:hypothetical protein
MPTEPAGGAFHTCVYQMGDVACPDTWIGKVTMSPGFTDTRSCSACTCDAAPSCTGGTVGDYVTNPTCQGAPILSYAVPSPCVDLALSASPAHVYLKATAMPAPTCGTPGGGKPTGSATPDPPITVCCL